MKGITPPYTSENDKQSHINYNAATHFLFSILRRIKSQIKRLTKLLTHTPITANIVVIKQEELLKGKNVIITGATSGIGRAIAQSFYDAGANIIITSRSKKRAESAAHDISADNKGLVIGVELDCCAAETFEQKVNEIISHIPDNRIDILVNNAGIGGGDIQFTTETEFDEVIATNLKSAFFLSRVIARHMIDNGVNGNILNIASSSSIRPATSAYTLSKWGIRGLTEGLAKMFAPHGIVVNAIAPGPTATRMLGKTDYSDISHPHLLSGRYTLPEEIAQMALFLCGPQGRTIIGDIIYMTGGAGNLQLDDVSYKF